MRPQHKTPDPDSVVTAKLFLSLFRSLVPTWELQGQHQNCHADGRWNGPKLPIFVL
jgi:hypothetical protein